MSGLDLRSLAIALGGEVVGRQVNCPGPNHSRIDRSLAVRRSAQSPTGFVVYSHAGDPFDLCRDYVLQKLGMDMNAWRTRGRGADRLPRVFTVVEGGEQLDHAARIARAVALWGEAMPAQGTLAERYLASRALELPPGAEVLRFHDRCPWRCEKENRIIFVPALVAAMRQVVGDALTAVHRTRLTPEGAKVDRRMLGVAASAAVKLSPDADVTTSLAVGEGVESVLAAQRFGFRPAWAMASAGAVAGFAALTGVETLTLFEENDDTSRRSVETCARRWHRAGRQVTIVTPKFGNDMNDALRGRAA